MTPGRWKAVQGTESDEKRWTIVADGPLEFLIATVENGQPGDTLDTERETAQAIAAVPELLDLCETAREYLGGILDSCDPDCDCILHSLDAAIAKAKGGAV